jgi:hypothetical protein
LGLKKPLINPLAESLKSGHEVTKCHISNDNQYQYFAFLKYPNPRNTAISTPIAFVCSVSTIPRDALLVPHYSVRHKQAPPDAKA